MKTLFVKGFKSDWCSAVFSSGRSDDVLNLIEKVYQRFARDPVLAHQYICQQDFEWGLQDEDTWPYFFGAIGMSFSYMGIQRESKYT